MANHSSTLAWRIPMDRGAWWATVHGVAKSQTRLSDSAQHTTVYKIDDPQGPAIEDRELYSVLCISL